MQSFFAREMSLEIRHNVQAVCLYLAYGLSVRRRKARSSEEVVAPILQDGVRVAMMSCYNPHTLYNHYLHYWARPNPLRMLLRTVRPKNSDSTCHVILSSWYFVNKPSHH
jgi:hypothetical protein